MSPGETAFTYEALTPAGRLVRGVVQARSAADATAQIRARGEHPVSVAAPVAPEDGGGGPVAATGRLDGRACELLFNQLAKLVGAGLALERSLVVIEQGDSRSAGGAVAGAIVRAMRAGAAPSVAFAGSGGGFDPVTLALIRSGETTGDLGNVLGEVARLIATRNQVRSRIATALVYPAILAVVSLGSLMTILLVVVPQFEELVRGHMDRLPGAALVVFWLSQTVRQIGVPLLVLAGIAGLLVWRSLRGGGLERAIIRVVSRAPGGGRVVRMAEAATFLRLLGSLAQRQVQLLPALDVARQAIVDPGLAAAVGRVRERLKSGARLGDAMAETRAFPQIAVQLARVGEETGDLGPMLGRAAQMLDDDLDRLSKVFLIWFEPVLLAIIGGLIGGLLYGLFSAILAINTLI